VETVAEFVRRTQGPAVPFVPDWYPWVYAHHYLRLETAQLPVELGRDGDSLTATEAREVIQLWCALSGEGIEAAARELADAYLRRWGLSCPAVPGAAPPAQRRDGPPRPEGSPRRVRRVRQVRRRATTRARTGTVASLVPAGRRASAAS
jgi:hypothetical protein